MRSFTRVCRRGWQQQLRGGLQRGLMSSSQKPPGGRQLLAPTELSRISESDFDCATTTREGRSKRSVKMLKRLGGSALAAMATKDTLTLVTATCAAIWSIAALEAVVLLHGGIGISSPNVLFVWAYGAIQVLPSCVWTTVPAETVAAAFDVALDPKYFIVSHGQAVADAAERATASAGIGDEGQWARVVGDSRRQLVIHLLQTLRSLLGGTVLLSQVFRAIGLSQRALNGLEARTMDGREPMLPGVKERVIRLAGRASDVTALSLRLHGEHIVPVFEEPHTVRHLVRSTQAGAGAAVPVFWRVEPGEYGFRHSWEGLGLDRDWLLRSSTGRRLLVVEADATNTEEALAIGHGSRDLTLEDAAQAARMLEAAAREALRAAEGGGARTSGGAGFRLLRVFLGNSRQSFESGGGVTMTLKERVQAHRSMDVVVDSRAPVLLALLKWTGRLAHELQQLKGQERDGGREQGGEACDDMANRSGMGEEEASGLSWLQRRWQPRDWFGAVGVRTSDAGTGSHREERLEPCLGTTGGAADADTPNPVGANEVEGLGDPRNVFWDDEMHGAGAPREGPEGGGTRPALVLSTSERDYFASMGSLLGEYGFRVVDHATLPAAAARQLPHVFYHRTTAETVTAVVDLVRSGAVDPRLCCAVVDKEEGAQDLRAFLVEREEGRRRGARKAERAAGAGLGETQTEGRPVSGAEEFAPAMPFLGMEIVCAAELYDGLLRQVRAWAREGHSAKQIQEALDEQFHDVLEQQRKVPTGDQDDIS